MSIEPDNHTAWIDRDGGTWIRIDELNNYAGHWFPLTDGPGFEPWAQTDVGQSRPWDWMDEYAPFTPADPDRTAMALDRVRQKVSPVTLVARITYPAQPKKEAS